MKKIAKSVKIRAYATASAREIARTKLYLLGNDYIRDIRGAGPLPFALVYGKTEKHRTKVQPA